MPERLKDHLYELKARLLWVAVLVIAASAVAYLFSAQLTALLQAPLNQTLYYTTPGGGLSFIVKLSLVMGTVIALPAITYHLLAFLAPLVEKRPRGFVAMYAAWSLVLAYCGSAFAYFVTLPAALHFLVQFGGENIQALIGANDYMNFVLSYVLGFCVLFQIPLIVMFIDRITPLKPGQMMKHQRYIILGSFVVAALFTPTPDPVNQAFMALPIIVLYQVGVLLIAFRRHAEKRALARSQKRHTPQRVRPHLAPTATPLLEPAAATATASAAPIRRPRLPMLTDVVARRPTRRVAATLPAARPTIQTAPRRAVFVEPCPGSYMDLIPRAGRAVW